MDPECVLIIFRSIVFVYSTHARVWVEVLWSEVKSLAVCFVKILSESRNAALFYIDFLDFFFFLSFSLTSLFEGAADSRFAAAPSSSSRHLLGFSSKVDSDMGASLHDSPSSHTGNK